MALTTIDPLALRLLMTEDLYSLKQLNIESIAINDPDPITTPVFNYLGENNKFMLILVNEDVFEHIDPKNLDTLNSILLAKKMELRDVAIVNLKNHSNYNFDLLKQFFSSSSMVLFGINPANLILNEISANHIALVNGVRILATFNFDEMRDDESKKRMFWNEMKNL
jgi:DNA polymerase III psi subunit